MESLFLIALAVILILAVKYYLENRNNNKAGSDEAINKLKFEYVYTHKDFLMTHSENDFSKILFNRFGNDYRIYPQIHLSSIIDHKTKNQNHQKGALSHIDRKSVDFVICDKEHSRPLCAIELDDWSHESAGAKKKDELKENLLAMADLPLIRINNWRDLSSEDICSKIMTELIS